MSIFLLTIHHGHLRTHYGFALFRRDGPWVVCGIRLTLDGLSSLLGDNVRLLFMGALHRLSLFSHAVCRLCHSAPFSPRCRRRSFGHDSDRLCHSAPFRPRRRRHSCPPRPGIDRVLRGALPIDGAGSARAEGRGRGAPTPSGRAHPAGTHSAANVRNADQNQAPWMYGD